MRERERESMSNLNPESEQMGSSLMSRFTGKEESKGL